jgi:hypothetical protein
MERSEETFVRSPRHRKRGSIGSRRVTRQSPPQAADSAGYRGTRCSTEVSTADLAVSLILRRRGVSAKIVTVLSSLIKLLPHLSNVVIEAVERSAATIVLRARSRTRSFVWPVQWRAEGVAPAKVILLSVLGQITLDLGAARFPMSDDDDEVTVLTAGLPARVVLGGRA